MSLRYRPEIDGLRSIAVLAVLIYHAKFAGGAVAPGGFLGVDVFFVISGYLITSLILKEYATTGRFSFARFYERRARRLLPVLLVVILSSMPAAWVILEPTQMVNYAQSLLASVAFVSNHFWHLSSQVYGAESGLLKPFLHTWSLAVEEQFYIVFPLLLMLMLRRAPKWLPAAGLTILIGGLCFAEMTTARLASLSFFWLPSRVWELTAGAALAYLQVHHPTLGRSRIVKALGPSFGILLIIGSMGVTTLGSHHPGLATVPAVLGTAMVIAFSGGGDLGTRLLASRPFVAVGLISYGLYLWHYPIFAFARLLDHHPSLWQRAGWILLSVVLATLTYHLVEQPARRTQVSLKRVLAPALGAGAIAIALFCAAMVSTEGLRSRLPHLVALYGPNEFDNELLRRESWSLLDDLAATHQMAPSQPREASRFEATQLWFEALDPSPKVLVVGNSHSKDLFNAIYLARDRLGVQVARYATPPATPPSPPASSDRRGCRRPMGTARPPSPTRWTPAQAARGAKRSAKPSAPSPRRATLTTPRWTPRFWAISPNSSSDWTPLRRAARSRHRTFQQRLP
ncbi:MAG: acyltransferase family protein, partial [Pseudomonadota bacterium]